MTEEFTQAWNFLCNLQNPVNAKSKFDNLSQVDQDLDDIEDFVEDDVGLECHLKELKQETPIRRRQVSLCRHKLQTRAYPKYIKVKKVWRSPERMLEPETTDLDHEWLQLIQLEKAIDEQKKLMLSNKIGEHGDPDEENEPFWETGESLDQRSDHLDDEDLEYVNNILNSFSRPSGNHDGSNNFRSTNVTQKNALARAFASRETPQKFNLKFNQKSATRGSEENHFSSFSNVEEERSIELGDYFSDDEENDTWAREDLKSENFYQWNPVISGLETIHEPELEDDGEAR